MNNSLKTYFFMVLCTGLMSTITLPGVHAAQGRKSVRTKTTPSTLTPSILTEPFMYPIYLGLGIGAGISITSACIAYVYQKSLQEWFTEIGEKVISHNAHKFPIHVNIPQEDVPAWVKWIVASLPELLNTKSKEAIQV